MVLQCLEENFFSFDRVVHLDDFFPSVVLLLFFSVFSGLIVWEDVPAFEIGRLVKPFVVFFDDVERPVADCLDGRSAFEAGEVGF